LDLQGVYEINYVKIWNRPDAQLGRLVQASVRVGMSDNYASSSILGYLTQDREQTVICNGVLGRYVFVVLPAGSSCLHFAEIEVYVPLQQGCISCDAGKYAAAGSPACTNCQAGKYQPTAGVKVCQCEREKGGRGFGKQREPDRER
jgi:hypothetical protein